MKTALRTLWTSIQSNRTTWWFNALVIAIVILILMAFGIFYPSTKLGFLLVIILAVVNPRLRGFGFDFLPFIVLLLTYNELRRFADDTGMSLNITNLIEWEKACFGGTLPGYWMQTHLTGHFYTLIIDVLANVFYFSHFITPVILAGVLWYFRRSEYWAFMIGLVVLSFAAFATYILFPAAPPWWATAHGYLRSTPITLERFLVDEAVVAAGPNPVAAMPSLHIAYPTYLALISITVWGKRGLPVILLPFCVLFSAMYLGHHYFVDGLAGASYALVIYTLVYRSLRKMHLNLNFFTWGNLHTTSHSARQ